MSDWHAMVRLHQPAAGRASDDRLPPRHGCCTQHAAGGGERRVARPARRAHRRWSRAPAEKFPTACCCIATWVPSPPSGHASTEAWNMTVLQARLFWRMVIGKVSVKNLSGPLSIAEFAGESAHAGAASFLSLLVLLSLSLGFLNLAADPDPGRRSDPLSGGGVAEGQPASERAQAFRAAVGHRSAHRSDGCRAIQRHCAPVQLIVPLGVAAAACQ